LRRAYAVGRDGLAVHPQKIDLALAPTVDETRLGSYLAPIIKMGTAAVDARLEVRKGIVAVVPESAGFSIDRIALEKVLRDNLTTFSASEPVLEPHVLAASIKTSDLAGAQAQAAALMATPITLTDGTKTITPSAQDIAEWLRFVSNATSGKVEAHIDEVKVSAYVSGLAKRLDRPATPKKINNINGTIQVVNEGQDGDAIEREPLIQALSKLTAGTPIIFGITRTTVPFKTTTTYLADISAGKYIEINLSQQHLWVWDNHQVIYDSPVTTGAVGVGLGTVVGTFQIYSKETNRYLTGQGYRVPVKYWMPFYRDYGLHDAVWRYGKFGGQDYIYGGSHGCVNLPDATAAWLYNWSNIGTPVYVHK
jgi:lipoprotein-anchoring transpeptidase ErfK/SrfK